MITILPNWHPIFVHFTVALLIVAAVLHLVSHFVPSEKFREQLLIVARWNLWIGIGSTVLTVAAGWYAFYTVSHDTPSHLAMIEHRNWAMATFAVFLGVAAWEYSLNRHGKSKGWLFTALLLLAASLLLSTAWHGGELVYRYGLGVMSMPKPEGPGHAHDHDDEHGHQDIPNGERSPDKGPSSSDPAADAGSKQTGKTGHAHAPGTLPHKD